MRKTTALIRSERGQSLPIIAMVFVGLLALVGLAIDGGNLFMQRRRAQNAADAAALAGTRLIGLAVQACDAGGNNNTNRAALDTLIARTINAYAEQNGISDTNGVAGDETNDNVTGYYVDANENRLGLVGIIPQVPWGTAGVEVEVTDEHDTFFMLVVGIDKIPSSGQAMAMTGVVRQFPAGGGILPIAVPQVVVEEIAKGQQWEMFDNEEGQFCYTDNNGNEICPTGPGTPQASQRGWLNLNHIYNYLYLGATDPDNRTFETNVTNAGCNSNPPGIQGYASGQCPYAYPIYGGTPEHLDGDFIHGSPGARASSVQEVYDNYAGQTVYVPVFDRIFTYNDMNDVLFPAAQGLQAADPVVPGNGGGFSSSGGGAAGGSGGGSWYYHVVGVTAVRLDNCGNNCPNDTLSGGFQYAVIAAGVLPTGFEASCQPLLHGVTLWE